MKREELAKLSRINGWSNSFTMWFERFVMLFIVLIGIFAVFGVVMAFVCSLNPAVRERLTIKYYDRAKKDVGL